MTNEKLVAARILDLAFQAEELVDEGFFVVVMNTGKVEEFTFVRDAGNVLLVRHEDVDGDTGNVRDGAKTWRVRVELEPE